ncbi:hypothetical protein SNEBB_000933 [Seison nebaliae]|nr:hypothetical protein SNEBB_000933 [Seison nebaliae]
MNALSPTAVYPQELQQIAKKKEKNEKDYLFGYGNFRPPALQFFVRNHFWVAFFLFLAGFLQGFSVNGLVNSSLSTIEKHLGISSKESSKIPAAYDFGALVAGLPVSLLCIATGTVSICIPHFLIPIYTPQSSILTCQFLSNSTTLASATFEETASYQNLRWFMVVGLFLCGIGTAPLYTLGFSFFVAALPTRTGNYYSTGLLLCSLASPSVGFMVGGLSLRLWVDIGRVNPEFYQHLNYDNDEWLGAYWIGFVVTSLCCILIGLILCGFPKILSFTEVEEKDNEILHGKQTQLDKSTISHLKLQRSKIKGERDGWLKNIKYSLRIFYLHCKIVMRVRSYLFLLIGTTCDTAFLGSVTPFFAKYLEVEFKLPPSEASIKTGYIAVPSSIIGCITAANFASCIASFAFLVHCENTPFDGLTEKDWSENIAKNTSIYKKQGCGQVCNCDETVFKPVCSGELTFFNPCYAGCMETRNDSSFGECKCTIDNEKLFNDDTIAKVGYCKPKKNCVTQFFLIAAFVSFGLGCSFFAFLPTYAASQSVVPSEERSLSLGIQWVVIRGFGSIPGPIVIGALLERACRFWQLSGEEKGTCRVYDVKTLGLMIGYFCIFLKVVASLSFFLGWIFVKKGEEETKLRLPFGLPSNVLLYPSTSRYAFSTAKTTVFKKSRRTTKNTEERI